ncbi:MAG: response regulator [Vicinamibacterales bacterium]
MTDEPLRILHLEDDPLDAELAAATLAGDSLNCVIECVASRGAFEAALVTTQFDIILSDYNLPDFDGLTAQGVARRLCPGVPFIFLSGALGEDLAADRLKDGATDFVLKQRIAKLPHAVRRARIEASLRDQAHRAEASLRALNAELEERVRARTAERDETRQRLEAILAYSPHVISVRDDEGRYVLVNDRFLRVFGATLEQVIGRTPHDIMPPRLADVVRAHDDEIIERRTSAVYEESVMEADGVHVYSSTRFPIYDAAGALAGICDIAHDITAEKQAQDELKLARLEAMRANHAKSEFLSHMSHELRTPLNAILGFAQLFDRASLSHEQAENVSQILSAGHHLLNLINGILDIARVESGKLSLSPEAVDVREAVQTAVDLVKPLAREREITIDIGPLPGFRAQAAVRADKQRLIQILLNLLSNAVKYNRHAGRITIEFGGTDSMVRIAVRDTGSGISPSKQRLLFQPFERLGAEQSGVEGTGLGLAFSRALCAAMHGHMGCDSIVDAGSTFWVELPFTADLPERFEAREEAPVERMTAPDVSGNILYIEDNSSNVRLMERMLARRPGLQLTHVTHGRAGIDAVRANQPDLVLLDMHLPDMSGEDVLRAIWEDPATRPIPVVILSADATPGLPHRLRAAGARGFLGKPLNVKQVLAAIDDLLAATVKEQA